MIIFMSNSCEHGHCMSMNCNKCMFYEPAFLGKRVPRWLGRILYRIESIINGCKRSGKF